MNKTDAAAKIGAEHGKNAASWVFDGNTTTDTYRWYLRGIDEGDPEVLDSLREPSLSGEFADDYDERDLIRDLELDDDDIDDAAGAYNQAASEAFWREVERIARQNV
jgi:hypothetical protein